MFPNYLYIAIIRTRSVDTINRQCQLYILRSQGGGYRDIMRRCSLEALEVYAELFVPGGQSAKCLSCVLMAS